MTVRTRIGMAIGGIGLTVLTGIVPARAAELYYVSGPAEQFRGYTQPVLVIRSGDTVTYVNVDANSHDVVADEIYRPDITPECALAGKTVPGTCPLFWSTLIGLAQTSPIYGIDEVAPGTYPFKCSIHSGMKGTLLVLPV